MNKNRRILKRFTGLFLALVMIISMAACSTTAGTNTNGEGTTAAQTTTKDGSVNIYMVRHGKTIMNTLGRVQGFADSPLTDAGIKVSKDAGVGMADIKFDYVYSSDRHRCLETTSLILEENKASEGLTVVPMKGLREVNFGKYEGELDPVMWDAALAEMGLKSMEELANIENYNSLFMDAVAKTDETGEAENSAELAERLMASVDQISEEVSEQGGGNVLVVTHGVAIHTITEELGAEAGDIANASVTNIVYKDGNYTVESVGDTSYAENGAQIREANTKEVTVYLTRHGKTVFNTMDRVQGWVDSPLTDAGIEVATQLGKGLSDVEFAGVYTSGMGCTIETAELVLAENATGKDLVINENPGLRETNYGKFEAGTNNDMIKAAMDYYKLESTEELMAMDNAIQKVINALHEVDETGEAENYVELSTRTYQVFKEICEEASQNGGGNILIVSHGNAIMSILDSLGTPNVTEIGNATVSKITYKEGEFKVESVGDESYIKAGQAKE